MKNNLNGETPRERMEARIRKSAANWKRLAELEKELRETQKELERIADETKEAQKWPQN